MTGRGAPRIAVVTGGTSGIGLATARHLLERGYRVAVFGQSPTNVDVAARELSTLFEFERVFVRCVDLIDPKQVFA